MLPSIFRTMPGRRADICTWLDQSQRVGFCFICYHFFMQDDYFSFSKKALSDIWLEWKIIDFHKPNLADFSIVFIRFICNRLALITNYSFDIHLALCSLFLLWEVNFNFCNIIFQLVLKLSSTNDCFLLLRDKGLYSCFNFALRHQGVPHL